jgi:two-component system, OmpR family, sensor histidine kinase KdpD
MDTAAKRKGNVKIVHRGAFAGSDGSVPRTPRRLRAPKAAPVVLPIAAGGLLAVGALVALTSGGVGPTALLVLTCVIVAATAAVSDPATLAMVTLIAEFTAIGFTRRPYAQLRGGPLVWHAGVTIVAVAAISYGLAAITRGSACRRSTLMSVNTRAPAALSRRALVELGAAIGPKRRWAATGCAAAALPLLTFGLVNGRHQLSLADDLLLYLLVVVAVSVVGGFWPAIVTAAASALLLNWFLTPPLHTLTIAEPQNLLALLLFIAVAIGVSSIVHLAARRAADAVRSSSDAAALLELARTVLAGADTPASVLDQLTAGSAARAELLESAAGKWVEVASSGIPADRVSPSESVTVLPLRPDLRLRLTGEPPRVSRRVLEGIGAQAAAALDRDRLRTQAAQAEALGEANRVRTALLTAVSHDLRTPLASIKAAISSLRQDDLTWSPEDEKALLVTIEEGSDRLEGLINNLLDMSRVHTGSLQPFLRPTALDEVVPLALRGLPGADTVVLDLPDSLPLIQTDAGLLERVVANLVANALRFSPASRPVEIVGRADGDAVRLSVIDHGPGVPAGERERIFEPFQRLGDRSSGAGVGLGLAVARGFTEAMGGRISTSSTPGGGLTMTVALATGLAAPSTGSFVGAH